MTYNEIATASTPVRRFCRLLTITGSNVPTPVPRHLDGDLTSRIREHRLGPGAVADVPGENDKLIWPHCDTLILAAPSGARCLA